MARIENVSDYITNRNSTDVSIFHVKVNSYEYRSFTALSLAGLRGDRGEKRQKIG
jgi:hypothetical protein